MMSVANNCHPVGSPDRFGMCGRSWDLSPSTVMIRTGKKNIIMLIISYQKLCEKDSTVNLNIAIFKDTVPWPIYLYIHKMNFDFH